MSRRGKCRCGTILVFDRTALGYKVRCPNCQAVVRLRREAAQHPRPSPPVSASSAPTAATDFDTPELVHEVESLESLHLQDSSAPIAMVEMEVDQGPKAAGRRGLWLLAGLAFVGLALAVGSILLILNHPS
jgi:hypothetical protein